MTLAGIPVDLQNLILLNYELQVKVIILFGLWIFSLVYLLYWYKRQQPTKIFLVGTFRASMYVTSFIWSWLFWWAYPVMIHPNVGIDNILLFITYSYTGIVTLFTVMFIVNFTLWIPKAIVTFGKLDLTGWEDHALNNYFGDVANIRKWWKKE